MNRRVRREGGLMSTKNDYSSEEWKAISSAPVAAGLFITLADANGLVGIAKEGRAVRNAISDAAKNDAPEIIKAVAESWQSGGERPEVPDVPKGDTRKMRVALIRTIKTAVDSVESKSP